MSTLIDHNVTSEEMTVDDAHAMFEARVRDALGISREDFVRRADAGEYDDTDSDAVLSLLMLLPFAR